MNSISGLSSNQIWNINSVGQVEQPVKTETAKVEVQEKAADQYEVKTPNGNSKTATGVELPAQGTVISYNSANMEAFDVILADSATASGKTTAAAASVKSNKAAVTAAINNLKNSAAFKAAPAEVQKAVLAQCDNFPNTNSVNQLAKMIGTKWFGKMNLADKQRAAKSIAYLAEISYASNNNQQKALINNTLSRILSDKIPLHFDNMNDDPGTITYGYAPAFGSGIYINRDLIPAGNDPFPKNNISAKHAAISTIVHETSHQVNKDVNNCSYKYFQAEYRAWYVGYIAENGKAPTRQEAFNRCIDIINLYGNINAALYSSNKIDNVLDWLNNKVTGDEYESKKMLTFLNQFIGAKNIDLDSTAEIKAFLRKSVNNPKAAAPIPDPALNHDMDN